MIDITTITTKELEDYRYCSVFYKIKKEKDKKITRYNEKQSVYLDSIKSAFNSYFEHIFKTNNDPNLKYLQTIVIRIFDKISNFTSEERFLASEKIDTMLSLAKRTFNIVEESLSNIVLHPIRYIVNLNHGSVQLQGHAFPIIRSRGDVSVIYIDAGNAPDEQVQFTNLNLAAFLLWLYDNAPEVTSIQYLDLAKLNKGFVKIPIYYKNCFLVQEYLSSLSNMIINKIFVPAISSSCNNCLGSCVNYIQ